MSKKIKVIIEQGVKIGGKYPAIGDEVSIDANEAKRLIRLGAASMPRVAVEKSDSLTAAAKKKLLEQTSKAETQDELEKLVAGNEDDQDITAAASQRLDDILAAEDETRG